jgi:hypothetical protein
MLQQGVSTAPAVIVTTDMLAQCHCVKCGARLFDYRLVSGIFSIEIKCYKQNCKHVNTFVGTNLG